MKKWLGIVLWLGKAILIGASIFGTLAAALVTLLSWPIVALILLFLVISGLIGMIVMDGEP